VLDLEEAIEKAHEAAALIPDDHLDRNVYLGNLALLLGDMYTRTESLEALNTAIDIGQKVLKITPRNEPTRTARLNKFSIQIRHSYIQKKAADSSEKSALADLDESIKCLREAVSLTGPKHLDRVQWLNNLGVPLGDKYKGTQDMSVLQESIKITQEAVTTLPESRADRAAYLNTLGD
jgi:tetratricopeptide (TPR) repeat protein